MKNCSKCGLEKFMGEFSKDKQKIDGICSTCKKCQSIRYHTIKPPLKIIDREKSKEKRRSYVNEWHKQRRKNDIFYKLHYNFSRQVRKVMKKNSVGIFSKLSYTPQQLKVHLETQFDKNMNWDNYGSYWHVDHIVPRDMLRYDSYQHPNFQKCWALSNLQPLEARSNMRKGNKVC